MHARQEMTAVVLAGGRSSRMGQNKLFLPLGGKPVICHLIDLMKQMFAQSIVVTDDTVLCQYDSVEVVQDIITCGQKNSLTGIHAGLMSAKYPYALIIAGDMPFVQPAVISYLCSRAEGYDVVVPREGRHYQPLCAVYHKNCLPFIEKQLAAGQFRVARFFQHVRLREIDIAEIKPYDPGGLSFININTPADYEKACDIIDRLQKN